MTMTTYATVACAVAAFDIAMVWIYTRIPAAGKIGATIAAIAAAPVWPVFAVLAYIRYAHHVAAGFERDDGWNDR